MLNHESRCGHAKAERTCQRIVKLAPALWTFVDTPGVEPTNDAAGRAIRPAVWWRQGIALAPTASKAIASSRAS